MDETDLKLIKLLWENPRASYRDLADALDISTPAVHRRIQAAREAKIILGPFARMNPKFLGAVQLYVFGKTEAASMEEVMEGLAKGDSTYLVTMMTGNVVLLRSALRDISELDKYVSFARKAARMPDPRIGLVPDDNVEFIPPDRSIKLTKLDFKIMHSLYKDGRKSVNDIADDINVSPKTVRNHLNRLVEGRILIFDLIANQAKSGNFVPLLEVNLEPGADKKEVAIGLNRRHAPPLIDSIQFSNHTNLLVCMGWLQEMAQLCQLVHGIGEEEGVQSVIPHVFIRSHKMETWLDKLLEDPVKAMDYCIERRLI